MKKYIDRVEELEREGCTRSDAQAVADVEVAREITKPDEMMNLFKNILR
jgi:hypothetical protein